MEMPVAGTLLAGEARHQIVIAPAAWRLEPNTTSSPASFVNGNGQLRLPHRAGVVIQPAHHAV